MINWQQQIEQLTDFCRTKGYEVQIKNYGSSCGQICFETKQITLDYRFGKEKQFYFLLHEIGHLLIHNRRNYEEDIAYGYFKYRSSSLISRISEVEEEFEAWRQGMKLAKRLNLHVNRDRFEEQKSRALISYFVWAAERRIEAKIKCARKEAKN